MAGCPEKPAVLGISWRIRQTGFSLQNVRTSWENCNTWDWKHKIVNSAWHCGISGCPEKTATLFISRRTWQTGFSLQNVRTSLSWHEFWIAEVALSLDHVASHKISPEITAIVEGLHPVSPYLLCRLLFQRTMFHWRVLQPPVVGLCCWGFFGPLFFSHYVQLSNYLSYNRFLSTWHDWS